MNNQTNAQGKKTLKSGKTEITLYFSEGGPPIQECMVNILRSHMTKKPKF